MNSDIMEYPELKKLYALYKMEKKTLYKYLNILTNNMYYPKGDFTFVPKIFEEQYEEEKKLPLKSRFIRNIMTEHYSKYLVDNDRFSTIFSCEPKIEFPEEESFNRLSDNEKRKIESDIYKGLAIISARIANLTNRLYKKISPDALTIKDNYIRDFLTYTSIYNYLVDENNQILFGFCDEYQRNGSVLLNASLPGYTRFSVHFGTYENFFAILKEANEMIIKRTGCIEFPTKNNSDKIDRVGVFKKFKYNIPTFDVTYNGIINSDDFNYIQNHASVFSDALDLIENGKAVNPNRSIKYAIEIFLYCYSFTYGGEIFNDREIYQIAERAKSAKGILLCLDDLLKERANIQENAKLNKRSPNEEYFFSRSNEQLKEILPTILKNDDFKADFILNLFFSTDGKTMKLNEKNIINFLSMIEDEKMKKEIFDGIQYELGDKKSLKEELKNYLKKSIDEKLDVHEQMMENTLDISKEERDIAEKEDKRILDWIEKIV